MSDLIKNTSESKTVETKKTAWKIDLNSSNPLQGKLHIEIQKTIDGETTTQNKEVVIALTQDLIDNAITPAIDSV